MIIISLIGEQPIPNLLPLRYQPPEKVVLVYTARTEAAAQRLERLLPSGCEAIPCPTSPYDIRTARRALADLLDGRGWTASDLLFNLTGGTKAMALAAYQVAAQTRSPFLYLQSEGKQTRLYRYEFPDGEIPQLVEKPLLPALLTIDIYLRAYVDDYAATGFHPDGKGGRFEQALYRVLEDAVDEIMVGVKLLGALDVDFIVRCDNQVGIVEAKTGRRHLKHGIDQLNTAGGQRYLGTYTQKLLVSDHLWKKKTHSNLCELAEARHITIIQLPSFGIRAELSQEERQYLARTVCRMLGKGSD